MKLSTLFVTLLVTQSITVEQALANQWITRCGRNVQESIQCKFIKGDAILSGSQGILNTIVFPNGVKYQYFYTGGVVCNLEGLMVRKISGYWFKASAYCTEENRLVFILPSGSIFFWVNAFDD